MLFFPEVAVQFLFLFLKYWALGPLNCHKWISHLLVCIVCNLKIYISKNLSLYIPCVLYTYYKYVLSSFFPLDIIIYLHLKDLRGLPYVLHLDTEHPRTRGGLAQYLPRGPRPGQHHHKPKCRKARLGRRAGKGHWGTGESDLPFIYENSLITSMMMELQPVWPLAFNLLGQIWLSAILLNAFPVFNKMW